MSSNLISIFFFLNQPFDIRQKITPEFLNTIITNVITWACEFFHSHNCIVHEPTRYQFHASRNVSSFPFQPSLFVLEFSTLISRYTRELFEAFIIHVRLTKRRACRRYCELIKRLVFYHLVHLTERNKDQSNV